MYLFNIKYKNTKFFFKCPFQYRVFRDFKNLFKNPFCEIFSGAGEDKIKKENARSVKILTLVISIRKS